MAHQFYKNDKNFSSAAKLYLEAVDVLDGNQNGELGHSLLKCGKYADAVHHLRMAINYKTGSEAAHHSYLSYALKREGNFIGALAAA